MKVTFSIEIDGAEAIVRIKGDATPHAMLCAIDALLMTQSADGCECASCTTIEFMKKMLEAYFGPNVSKIVTELTHPH
jgi:hypothetical protein